MIYPPSVVCCTEEPPSITVPPKVHSCPNPIIGKQSNISIDFFISTELIFKSKQLFINNKIGDFTEILE